jgi:hypothetical protein
VISATLDPPQLREINATVAANVLSANTVEIESDHYLTLRERDQVSSLLPPS